MRKANFPKARTRTMLKSWSRFIIGFFVAHLLSTNCLVLTKYTSAMTGEANRKGNALRVESTGKLSVVSE